MISGSRTTPRKIGHTKNAEFAVASWLLYSSRQVAARRRARPITLQVPEGVPACKGVEARLFCIIDLNSTTPASIRVLVVDDHPLMREGLLAMLRTQSDMTVVAEAGSGTDAVAQFGAHHPDVVLMDLRLPGMSGVEAIRKIRSEFPEAKIIMLTTYNGDEDIYRALEAGAKAYMLKETLGIELLEVIRDVHAGQKHIPPAVSARLAEYLPRAELSSRELEVLRLIAEGLRNKEIAAKLGIAEPTVKIHVQKIFSKLNVIDRTQAVVTAAHRGIIHL